MVHTLREGAVSEQATAEEVREATSCACQATPCAEAARTTVGAGDEQDTLSAMSSAYATYQGPELMAARRVHLIIYQNFVDHATSTLMQMRAVLCGVERPSRIGCTVTTNPTKVTCRSCLRSLGAKERLS